MKVKTGTRKIIRSERFHKVKAPVSHAVRVGNLVFVSGTPPYKIGGEYREMAVGNFSEQFRQSISNMKLILEESGSSIDRVCKVNVFLARAEDFSEMNDLYRQVFHEGDWPARTTVVVGHVIPDMLIEIECVAEVVD